MSTFFALSGIITVEYQLSNRKRFWSDAHPTFSPSFLLTILAPALQPIQHYLRQITIITSISYNNNNNNNNNYYYSYYYWIIQKVHKIEKPCYICTVTINTTAYDIITDISYLQTLTAAGLSVIMANVWTSPINCTFVMNHSLFVDFKLITVFKICVAITYCTLMYWCLVKTVMWCFDWWLETAVGMERKTVVSVSAEHSALQCNKTGF